MHAVSQYNLAKMTEGARNYAAADRSDPFAFNRAMSHIHNGIAGFTYNKDGSRNDAYYKADKIKEKRRVHNGQTFSDGTVEFTVESYINMQRP